MSLDETYGLLRKKFLFPSRVSELHSSVRILVKFTPDSESPQIQNPEL
jgi:hypothetical protein